MPRTRAIEQSTLRILAEFTEVKGNSVTLTCGTLDRKSYEAVNKALEAIGGKWNRGKKAHLFTEDVEEAFDEMVSTGVMPKQNVDAFFPTPRAVAYLMRDHVSRQLAHHPRTTLSVLEPSCGEGDLLVNVLEDGSVAGTANLKLTLVERNPARMAKAKARLLPFHPNASICVQDFMSCQAERVFDLVTMNSPFSLPGSPSAWVDHVLHAWDMVAPFGVLAAIVPAGILFRKGLKFDQVRGIFGEFIVELDEGSFSSSGTEVSTCLCVARRQ